MRIHLTHHCTFVFVSPHRQLRLSLTTAHLYLCLPTDNFDSHSPLHICICVSLQTTSTLTHHCTFVFVSPHRQLRLSLTTAHLYLCLPTDNFDSHNAQRMACHNKAECYGRGPAGVADNVPFAWDEGDVQIGPGTSEPHTDRLALHQRRSSIFMITISTRTHHLSGRL
jgi:hypothetical protein